MSKTRLSVYIVLSVAGMLFLTLITLFVVLGKRGWKYFLTGLGVTVVGYAWIYSSTTYEAAQTASSVYSLAFFGVLIWATTAVIREQLARYRAANTPVDGLPIDAQLAHA